MAPVKTVVSGRGSINRQPELGIVSLLIQSTGTDQASIAAQVRQTVQDIKDQIRPLAAPRHADYRAPSPAVDAAIARWSSSSLSTHSYYEDDIDDAQQKNKVYEASVTISATFRDFERLSDFTMAMATVQLATVHHVEWVLTDATQQQLCADAVKKAYGDALAKAKAFAEAMEKTAVKPVEITQASDHDHYPRFGDTASDLPEDVECSVDCEVTFEVE